MLKHENKCLLKEAPQVLSVRLPKFWQAFRYSLSVRLVFKIAYAKRRVFRSISVVSVFQYNSYNNACTFEIPRKRTEKKTFSCKLTVLISIRMRTCAVKFACTFLFSPEIYKNQLLIVEPFKYWTQTAHMRKRLFSMTWLISNTLAFLYLS